MSSSSEGSSDEEEEEEASDYESDEGSLQDPKQLADKADTKK